MTNRLRTQIEEEEKKLIVEEKPEAEFPDNFLTQFLSKGFINAESATKALPFVLFLTFLGMVYIANRHLAERNIRDIDKISKQVKEFDAAQDPQAGEPVDSCRNFESHQNG